MLMATMTLKNIKKIYPRDEDEVKKQKKEEQRRIKRGEQLEEKKDNRQITEQGVVDRKSVV